MNKSRELRFVSSPYINRFLQPDTDVPARQGVQGLNRYVTRSEFEAALKWKQIIDTSEE